MAIPKPAVRLMERNAAGNKSFGFYCHACWNVLVWHRISFIGDLLLAHGHIKKLNVGFIFKEGMSKALEVSSKSTQKGALR